MAYRKITVNGTEYQYTIGRSFTKVRGHAVWRNSEVGDAVDDELYVVQPSHIAEMILHGKRKRETKMCMRHNKPKEFRCNPFEYEIHGRTIFEWMCEDCHNSVAADI